jgi:hypothetical protein
MKKTLIIINNNNALTSKVINNNDITNHHYYYKLKHIIDNLKAVNERRDQQSTADDLLHDLKLIYIREFLDTVEQLTNHPNYPEIEAFLNSTDTNSRSVAGLIFENQPPPPPPQLHRVIFHDSDSDTDSETDDGVGWGSKVQILTAKQKAEILLLKPLLTRDGKRSKWHYTKNEYNIGVMITKITNNNEKAYKAALEVLFNEARARAI